MSYVLRDHQKRLLELMTDNDRFLVLPEQGTGKTLATLVHLRNLILAGEVERALIVCTMSGLAAWDRDTLKFSPSDQKMLNRAITKINYDKLSRKGSKWQTLIWESWDFIVLDESHAVKRYDSNRTKYFLGKGHALGLVSKARYCYLLTGTLITNSHLEDLWAPLRAVLLDQWPIDGKIVDMTWADFKRRYLVTRQLPGSYAEIVVGYRNRAELLDLVARYSYRVLKRDCLDLPPMQPDEVIYVPFADGTNAAPFNKNTKALYADALESYVEALDKVADNPLTRLMLMRQVAAGHVKEDDIRDGAGRKIKGTVHNLKSLKTKYALELIEANLPNKTVVFYQFTASCHMLEAALKRAGISYCTLNGEQKNKGIWQQFQKDDTKVFIGQYQSASRAIDLFASSYTIYLEPTDSSEMDEQSRARTDRHGQQVSCEYVFLLTEGTVEVEMYKKLLGHEDFSETQYRDIARAQVRSRR